MTHTSTGGRPLLDLFPPPPGHDRAEGPAIVGAPPPQIVRSRSARHADSDPHSPTSPSTYEPFYGLSESPFSVSPDTKFIYHGASGHRVLRELIEAIGRGDGMMVLTGEPGVGKTTVCRSLIEQLGRRTVTSVIGHPVSSFEDLLKTALVDFGVIAREESARGQIAPATRQELVAALGDFAASLAPLQASAVIIVDDTDEFRPDILEPLSSLSDVDADRRVQVVLVGQPTLAGFLRRKELRSIEQRVSVRCRLDPLTTEEVSGYVAHRLAMAGPNPRVEFAEGALAELDQASHGVPRLVNLVCDRALALGQEKSTRVIDGELIATAAADLELAPRRSGTPRLLRIAVQAIAFIALMIAGAAAAAWMFRAQLPRLLGR